MLKRLDRFLIGSFIGPFILIFLIVIFALMLQFLWLYIDELVGKGLSLWVILEFLGWGAATLIPLALPIATLLASIMTLGGMGEHNELLAMKAAGISLQRILRPLIVISLFLSVGAFFASNNLIPISYNKIYSLRDDIGNKKEEIKIPVGIFYNGIEGYTIRIADRDKKSGAIYDVMVYDHTNEGRGNVSLTLADSGMIKFSADKQNLLFTLYDGYAYEEEPRSFSYSDTLFPLQRIGFSRQDLVISLENYAFTRSEEGRFSDQVMTQNLGQLREVIDSLDSTYSKVVKNQFRKLILSGGLTYGKELDSSFAGEYSAVAQYDSLFLWENLQKRHSDLRVAVTQFDNALTLIENFVVEEQQYLYPLRKARIESYRKFTLSIACLIFFFIGAPLGAIIRKGGLGASVIISMLFFVIYWVVDISGKKLATDGVIDPALGTLISSAILFPIGIYLTWKSTRDSALFNLESYTLFFKRFYNKFKRDGENKR